MRKVGCRGEVDVLGGTKDGGRCAKNGDGVWLMGARVRKNGVLGRCGCARRYEEWDEGVKEWMLGRNGCVRRCKGWKKV